MTELAAALPVDIMPGPDDPANVSLPQQPLHQCLFPGAAPYSSFRRVTNPHAFELGGCMLLGTAGQNVDDMAKYTRGKSRCVQLSHTTTCSGLHLARRCRCWASLLLCAEWDDVTGQLLWHHL
jgi:DNA polymerase delta subunit 2